MSLNLKEQPNVIVFFTDQQRYDTTGVHGNPLGLTPNFDRMAQFGTHFYHSFTCQPVCGPARACLQTGLYPTTSGCYRNRIPLPRETRTLAHYFRDAGYHTGYIGKWHLADTEPVPQDQRGGYQHWLAANALESTSDAYDAVIYNNDNQKVKLPGYRVDALTDAAIRYIDKHQEDPFYLFVSYLEPHHQNHRDDYPAPDIHRNLYQSRWIPPDLAALEGTAYQHLDGYLGMVKRLDEALGRMREALQSLGILDNTIVLFTSDHGCHFKTRNSEYKRSCHESSIRVPTALSGPGFDNGGTVTELISLIDLSPTLLDAAGLSVPEEMEGRSVMPLLRKEACNWQKEVLIQISESQNGRAIRTKRWKYGVNSVGHKGDMSSDVYEEQYLYDLYSDPYELVNLVGEVSHREVADQLGRRLVQRMLEIGEAKVSIKLAVERKTGKKRVDKEALEL